MSFEAKTDALAQNMPYAGSGVLAGVSLLTFNQWMGLLGLLVSVILGFMTYRFNVRMQQRRDRREQEFHEKRMEVKLETEQFVTRLPDTGDPN
ncbi:hypothetical protein ACTXGQ_04270 [Marinobacter sp. 1Y8]